LKLLAGNPVAAVHYHYDLAGNLIAETDASGAVIREYLYAGSYRVAMISSGTYYIHNDHLGTPQVISDANQQIAWAADYAPFGEKVLTASAIENPLRFPGQYEDGETGLYYNYFRDYDASLGRYIQSDPIGLDGGLNTYAYVHGNPIRYTDPKGLAAQACLIPPVGAACASAAQLAVDLVAVGVGVGLKMWGDSGTRDHPTHAEEDAALGTPQWDDCENLKWAIKALSAAIKWRKKNLNPAHVGTLTYVNHQKRIKILQKKLDELRKAYRDRCGDPDECEAG
jgi:RHS repeat-associated protein